MNARGIMKSQCVRFWLMTSLAVLLTAAGCAGTYGHLERSSTVADQFHQSIVLPDYRYYYTGPDVKPDAILGLHKSYTLASGIWKPVDLDAGRLRDWIDWLNSAHMPTPADPYGYAIKNDDGHQIGVWYSAYEQIAVQLFEDGRVTVSLPRNLDTQFPFLRIND